MVQANSVADSLRATFGMHCGHGIVLAVLAAAVILGGIKRIGEVTESWCPFMAIFYLGGGLVILRACMPANLPDASGWCSTVRSRAPPRPAGLPGRTMMMALRTAWPAGSSPTRPGWAARRWCMPRRDTDHPVRQGLYGIFEVFVDTILVCTATGLVILRDRHVAGWRHGRGAGRARRSRSGCPARWGNIVVTDEPRAVRLLHPDRLELLRRDRHRLPARRRAAVPYRLLWLVFIYLGAMGSLHLVWDVADTLNGLMALPNIVTVLLSVPLIRALTREFFTRPRRAS